MSPPRARRIRWVSRRHRGQVIVIALLAIILLAGMVFYVFNLGDQVNRRVSMQNAADSAAIGGATWMARSMNVVAMNNVAQTRLVTMAAVLDSLPLATEITYQELDTITAGLESLRTSLQTLPSDRRDLYLEQGIESMLNGTRGGDFDHPGLNRQKATLQPLYDSLVSSGYDLRPLTHYRLDEATGPPPHGELWVGAQAMEDFNRATVQTAGLLSQATAVRMGEACIVRDPDAPVPTAYGSAFLLPVLPQLPARLGEFADLRRPIEEGRPAEYVAGSISDHIRRGPYDQLYHWRDVLRDAGKPPVTERTNWVPPRSANPSNPQGKPGLSPGPPGGQGGYWQTRVVAPGVPGPQIGWRPYGVYAWAVTRGNSTPSSGLAHYAGLNVPDLPPNIYSGGRTPSNFLSRVQTLARAKLDMIWGAPDNRSMHRALWIADYPKAREFALANEPAVKYTWLWILRIRSSLPPGDPGYRRTAGTFYPRAGARDYDPYSCPVQRGWLDPADPKNVDKFGNAVQIANYVWQTDWTYEVAFDESIGLHAANPGPPTPGAPAPPPPPLHTVYVRDQFVFFGIDVGGDVKVRNVANWQSNDPRPRPYLLDLDKADYRTDGEREYLSFLGVARQTSEASFWPGRFGSGNPFPSVLAVAEAHVFNNMSWDLWTQDWQARLRPTSSWDRWVNERMQPLPGDLATVRDYVDPEEVIQVRMVLERYDPTLVAQIKRQ